MNLTATWVKFYNMKSSIALILFTTFLSLSFAVKAQVNPEKLNQFLSQPSLNQYNLQQLKAVKEFYKLTYYNSVWLTGNVRNVGYLSGYINSSVLLGLDEDDYQPVLFKNYRSGLLSMFTEKDSIITELKLTDAAIHFFHDVLMGNKPAAISYNGLNYYPDCFDLSQLLLSYLSKDKFDLMLNDIESKEPAYVAVKTRLNLFIRKTTLPGFKDAVVNSNKITNGNQPLKQRLFQLGILENDTAILTDVIFKAKLKESQKLFGLLNDGMLRAATTDALNVPLQYRIQELKTTLNTIRWLSCIKQTSDIIVVNIPSATLLLYEHGNVVLESRIVVGKQSTTTPTLSSTITEVILYPYWNVPFKIATKELLPVIKRNRGYLNANGFQVLNNAGKVVDPSTVNWRAFSTSYFPYTIRQSTGCDNSLGLIKLNFYNPFSVYLHDTPFKALFSSYRRYYSHGCMRLEKAMEVGHYLLKGNTIAIDTLEEKGCLNNQQPIIVPATEQMPVFVLYNTAWVDSAAHVIFFTDVYNKLNRIRK